MQIFNEIGLVWKYFTKMHKEAKGNYNFQFA